MHVDTFRFSLVHRGWIIFTQVTALAQARPPENPQRYPHVAHRFLSGLHKSSTSLCTDKPGLPGAPAGKSLPRQQEAANMGAGNGTARGGTW